MTWLRTIDPTGSCGYPLHTGDQCQRPATTQVFDADGNLRRTHCRAHAEHVREQLRSRP